MRIENSLRFFLKCLAGFPTEDAQRLSAWQLIFVHSKVNGASYRGEELSQYRWDWPCDTYLQRRATLSQTSANKTVDDSTTRLGR